MNPSREIRADKVSLLVLAAHCFIFASLNLFYLLYDLWGLEAEPLIYPTCCLFMALAIWTYWSWYLVTQSLFNPYLLFFISAVLFNGGQALLEVFHMNTDGILEGKFTSERLIKTLFFVILALSAFHLGGLISAVRGKVIGIKTKPKEDLETVRKDTYKVGWTFFSISFLPSVMVIQQTLSIVLSGGYFSLYQQDDATSFEAAPQKLSEFLVPAALFILAGSKKIPKSQWISASVILVYAGTRFFLGQRNQALMALLACTWLWNQMIKPIPKSLLLGVGAFLGFIVLPLVGATRNSAGQDRLSADSLFQTLSSIDNPVAQIISEMGGSMDTVAYTLELVPKVHGYNWGADYLYGLLTLMPNLFWKLHPSIERGTSGKWLTWQIKPSFAARGGSLGFSFIAEAYLNFGWAGGMIALGVLGFLVGKLTLWAMRSENPARMAMVASFTSFFMFYARADSITQVRSLVWYSQIPYGSVRLLGWLRAKKLIK
ncbi:MULTISPECIES: O-antigen polysaccharide polymerase Wzy [unclassified Microcoleus]|uniref:O-antigen polysaccharide polymerase Wzy n=1 Tax=unclassified Microcoleus TaxID=2642155 RepID=UPI002FD5A7B1